LLQELREVDDLLAVALMDADEVPRHVPLAEQIVERGLEIGLLPQRIRPRRREHFVRPHRRKMTGKPLEHITIRGCGCRGVGCGGLRRAQQCCARLHALVADEPRVAGNHRFDIAGGVMTKLAAAFGDEEVRHRFLLFLMRVRDHTLQQRDARRAADDVCGQQKGAAGRHGRPHSSSVPDRRPW
jgi:hypothetical protein